jgi:hypothetical protein
MSDAREAALEEAARVAEAMAKRRFTKDMREMLTLCAFAIRALKDKPSGSPEQPGQTILAE